MNSKNLFLFILLLSLTLSVSGQKVKNKQFSLFDYNLDVSSELIDELSPLESFINKIKLYNDSGNDKIKAIFIHNVFYTLKDKLEQQLEVEILPINTFMRKVKYDDYGYPNTSIRDALRKGYSKFYFEVNAKFESITKQKKDEDPGLFDGKETYIMPQISIEITVYNNQGIIPVYKWLGVASADKPLPINDYLLKGFDNTEMEVKPLDQNQDDNLYLILDRAIQNAIQVYLSK